MLSSVDKRFIKDLVGDILLVFKEEGYLKIHELKEYVKTTVNLEKKQTNKDKRDELIKESLNLIVNSREYQEFLLGKVKMCVHCKKIKLLSEYHSHSGTIDKKRTECKECHSKYNKSWRENNREKARANQHRYVDRHKEVIKERKKKWKEKNRDKVRESQKRWYEENQDRVTDIKGKSYLKKYISKKTDKIVTPEEAELLYQQQKLSGLTPSEFYMKVYMRGINANEKS